MEETERIYLPAAGHDWLLPLYDPLTKLLGIEFAHRELLDQARIPPGHRVLEIGCGTGNLAILAKRLYPATEVVGLDPDPKALARARRKAEREGLSIKFDRGFSETLPLKSQTKEEIIMATVSVRYIVNDVDAAISFYTNHLGFSIKMNPAPGFAMLSRGDLRLLLNTPGAGGAGQAMPDGSDPKPGGWNRIQLEIKDLESLVDTLRKAGAHFRNDIVIGRGGKQILLDDPAGNCIELFEPHE